MPEAKPPVPDLSGLSLADAIRADDAAAAEPRRPMQWAELEGRTPPERQWLVAHWLSHGPMLLAGKGGIGKTLLAQTLATALALGRHFIDTVTSPAKVLFWACEDDHDELWRRQIAICRYFGVPLSALEGRLVIEPRLGHENTLLGTAFGQPCWTSLHEELRQQVNDYAADVLMLDNIGQTYGCLENDRHQVTKFVNGIVGLVSDRPFSAMLMGHPAKAAESEFAGSTAWENAVRMRWFLGTKLPDQPDAADAEDGIRYLAKRKSNYSVHDWRRLGYRDGVLIPEASGPTPGSAADQSRKEDARRCVLSALRKLTARQLRTTASRNSPDYLPRKIVEMHLGEDYSVRDLGEAMNVLMMEGRLVMGRVGTYPNRTAMTGLMEPETTAQSERTK